MKDCDLGDYLFYEDALVRCVAVNDGYKEVILETLEETKCPHCGNPTGKQQIHVIVSSPLFQQNARPVQTPNP